MKKKSLLFLLYSFVMLGLIVALLIFVPKGSTTNVPNGSLDDNTQQEQESNTSGENSNENIDESNNNNSDQEDELYEGNNYATEIRVNHIGQIYTYVNIPLVFNDDFVSVEPSDYQTMISYRITSRYGSDISKVDFDGEIFISTKAGQYNLIYSVPSSDNKMLEAKVIVIVKDDDQTVIQTKDTLKVGDIIDVNEFFNIYLDPFEDIVYTVDDKISILDNKITALNPGESKLIVRITIGYVSREYVYKLYIREQAKYFIELTTNQGETLETDDTTISANIGNYMLGCVVYNSNHEKTPQDITIVIDNKSKAELILASDGLIILNLKSKGIVRVDIVFNLDTSIRRTVYINID